MLDGRWWMMARPEAVVEATVDKETQGNRGCNELTKRRPGAGAGADRNWNSGTAVADGGTGEEEYKRIGRRKMSDCRWVGRQEGQ